MTKKQKKNALIIAGVAGAGILIWYLWDKKIGPFAPVAVLAPATSATGTNAPTSVTASTAAPATGSTTNNISTVNTGSTVQPVAVKSTSPITSGRVFVPFTAASLTGGMGMRQINNVM